MKSSSARFFFLLTLSSFMAFAQAPLPALRIEPATGSSILFVRDAATQPALTAFLVELVHYPGSYYQLWEDDVAQPVAPDVEKRIPISNMTVGAVPNYVKITAAIYADGTTSGVPDKVTQLVERRKFLLKTTRELISRLEKAHAAGTAAPAVEDELKQWAETMPSLTKGTQNSQDAINQSAAKTSISDTAALLANHSIEETLTTLRAADAAFASSKPTL